MSRNNHIALHHISKKRQINFFDRTIVVAAFISPLFGIPQVAGVLSGNIAGVSLFSWIGFMFFALLFLMYGYIHRIKPIIISNALWLVIDGFVVAGVVSHRFLS